MKDAGGNTKHLTTGAGKDTIIYVADRDNMGKFNSVTDQIYQEISSQLGGQVFSMPAYFNGTVYYGAEADALKAFPIINAKLALAPASQTAHQFGFPGTTPSISANGTASGIVWAIENSGAILFAYDAADLTKELYDSDQAANGRDHFSGNKFITPVVVNGKVYVGTPTSVAVFGLLP
jgi:outer membrane protein assembly factor BamB